MTLVTTDIQEKKIGRTHFLALKRQSLRGLQEWLMQYQAYWGNDNETLENYATYLKKIKEEVEMIQSLN